MVSATKRGQQHNQCVDEAKPQRNIDESERKKRTTDLMLCSLNGNETTRKLRDHKPELVEGIRNEI
jgi:hypothetical protein